MIHRIRWVCGFAALGLGLGVGLSGCGGGENGGIVSLSPGLTEVVYALGMGDQVIGVGERDDYPPAVLQMERLGSPSHPNVGRLSALQPSHIFTTAPLSGLEPLEGAGITQIHQADPESLDELYATIEALAEVLGRVPQGAALIATIQEDFAAVQRMSAEYDPPSVLLVVGHVGNDLQWVMAAGAGSIAESVITVAGGTNVFADRQARVVEVSQSEIEARAPEVIIEFHPGRSYTQKQQQKIFNAWTAYDALPAVKNGRIFVLTDSYVLRPGPRLPDAARSIAGLLHSELSLAMQ